MNDKIIDEPKILLMFSGGLDSTGVFWKLIQEKEELHVHHLYLVNKENRAKAEDKAVKDIINYMKKIRNFSYSESYHEYPCYNGSFLWDSDIFSFMAGGICLNLKSIEKVAIGMTKSDMNGRLSNRIKRANKIFEAFGSKAQKAYPLSNMTKKEIFEMLPEDLRNLSWSCRTPIYENDDIKKCGKCKTCKEINLISPK